MRFSLVAALLPALSLAAHFDIPEVVAVVDRVKQDYARYLHYTAAPGTANKTSSRASFSPAAAGQPYWYEQIAHKGVSAFGAAGFQVYRNVKDFGAKGDGVTDDTAAINAAMNNNGACGRGCPSSTTQPLVVYFPQGNYRISSPLNLAYYTMMIGNPNNPPQISAFSGFSGFGLIDANPYYTQKLNWGATNVFMRQIRNFIIDTTAIPPNSAINGIHWPTAQATSIQNVQFHLSQGAGTQHVGLFIEEGSAGLLVDLTFTGGLKGAALGNQQYMVRNLVFNNCGTAISMFWDWTFAMKSISINNCGTGIDMSAGGASGQTVGSITLYDSSISNTNIGVATAWGGNTGVSNGSLVLENVALSNVGTAVSGSGGALLAGGSYTVQAYAHGHQYTPNGPSNVRGNVSPVSRVGSLVSGSKYYEASKPQFENLAVSQFITARSQGATGNGVNDDSTSLQNAINAAASAGKVLFLDAGTYRVTKTIFIPKGSKIVGEAYPVIMSSGSYFNNQNSPQAVVRVGNAGDNGNVQWTDTIVATQGAQAGAILIEWNLATSGTPSGMWDVHTRIGGFAGSQLQVAQCPTSASPSANCIAAHTSIHITKSASNLYMENCWFWTADHDIDSNANTQISVYSGRGMLNEGNSIWLSGVGSEHHAFYQFQFLNAQNIYASIPQTESPYYQPKPAAPAPFTPQSSFSDPTFSGTQSAWGIRTVGSSNIAMYGAGFYSFFNSYSTTCSNAPGGQCQSSIVSFENSRSISAYNLATVGATTMITIDGSGKANYRDNLNVYSDSVALFRL